MKLPSSRNTIESALIHHCLALPKMISPDVLILLLWVLVGLLACIVGLLPNAFDRQISWLSKCLLFILFAACGALLVAGGELALTPQVEKNAIWIQKVYWTLGIGYAFSLPTTVYLLNTRQSNNTTTANFIPEGILQQSRQKLLNFMAAEVNIRLEDSLNNDQFIPLGLKDQREQVGRPGKKIINSRPAFWQRLPQPNRLLKIIGGSKIPLNQNDQIIDVFNRDDIAGRLLILGTPGSGKTTTLLELAKDLIKHTQNQLNQHIPEATAFL
jgi:hypothetical protein